MSSSTSPGTASLSFLATRLAVLVATRAMVDVSHTYAALRCSCWSRCLWRSRCVPLDVATTGIVTIHPSIHPGWDGSFSLPSRPGSNPVRSLSKWNGEREQDPGSKPTDEREIRSTTHRTKCLSKKRRRKKFIQVSRDGGKDCEASEQTDVDVTCTSEAWRTTWKRDTSIQERRNHTRVVRRTPDRRQKKR